MQLRIAPHKIFSKVPCPFTLLDNTKKIILAHHVFVWKDDADGSILITLWYLNQVTLSRNSFIWWLEASLKRRSWYSYHRVINALRVSLSFETRRRVTIYLKKKLTSLYLLMSNNRNFTLLNRWNISLYILHC